jgi:hypothetical protein
MTGHTLRIIWPIRDETVSAGQIAREVQESLRELTMRAKAVQTGPGSYRVARSQDVPGSGGTTPLVLVFECPARPVEARVYHRATG